MFEPGDADGGVTYRFIRRARTEQAVALRNHRCSGGGFEGILAAFSKTQIHLRFFP